jgi:hypothetical protein
MTHIRESRVIGNHADMGASTAKQQEDSEDSHTDLTTTDGQAVRRRRTRRRIGRETESPQHSDGAAAAPDEPDSGGRQ